MAAGLGAMLALCLLGAAAPRLGPAAVDQARMLDANKDAGQWMSSGRTYAEERFSPLTQINDKTVSRLGLAWYAEYPTYRGNEATPLEIDGVLYNTTPWNVTFAYDAKTGALLWSYDPKVAPLKSRDTCCDIVTRGLAAWKGKIFIGALDGRVIALDAKTGQEVWSTQTFAGEKIGRNTITGAPRAFNGLVFIGNAGADLPPGVRGSVAALDAETGKIKWRFYLTPGPPGKKDGQPSDDILEKVRGTWTGDDYWKTGGGGTAWDSMVYDPKLNMIYIGTGNGYPWYREKRSPQGGDNLFLSSIVALKADTGQYVWHYQETPGEEWDYTATQPMILTDLKIDGTPRKVLMQAPKNGYFYVIDRVTGKLLSATPFAKQTWTQGLDANGRPIVDPAVRYGMDPILVWPAGWGAHNWNPMSYSPKTGLVYLPVTNQPQTFSALQFPQPGEPDPYAKRKQELAEQASRMQESWLAAWDPLKRKEAWRIPYTLTGNGGTLATAGNLVVQGTVDSNLNIYAADTGKTLWRYDVQNVAISGAISYTVDGEQYIAVNVGWGGGLAHADNVFNKAMHISKARLVVFKLGGDAKLPPLAAAEALVHPPGVRLTEAEYMDGSRLYEQNCATCHGHNAAGGIKDLRRMNAQTRADFFDIVRHGKRASQGMASFGDKITDDQAKVILKFLMARANEDWGKY
jgi:quinohemoprotein ethanol dehydrogenase